MADLERFVRAQDPVFDEVLAELRRGRKDGHWMWFVFPQVQGLGHSERAQFYAIASPKEAQRYLRHPVLGLRLRECTRLVVDIAGRSLEEIFGHTDALKFRSSMTLFAKATADNALFLQALAKYCNGKLDDKTLELLDGAG